MWEIISAQHIYSVNASSESGLTFGEGWEPFAVTPSPFHRPGRNCVLVSIWLRRVVPSTTKEESKTKDAGDPLAYKCNICKTLREENEQI